MTSPDAAPAETEPEQRPPPARLTWALLGLIVLVFVGELTIKAGPGEDWISPSLPTLIAWGGMSHALVIDRGEWFRLITAAFVHSGPAHLAMNGLALAIAGGALEILIGRIWLAALFLIGAAAGGLASIHLNAANVVGVGASGAIMALFGFFLAIAFRFEKGPVRKAFLVNGLGTLVPSLLPGLIPDSGLQVDYAAHAGGALAGAAIGLLFLLVWPRSERHPPFRLLAALVVFAGAGTLAYAAPRLMADFAEAQFIGHLIPDREMPRTDEAARARADDLVRRYPGDARGYFYRALAAATRGDAAAAERDMRKAIDLAEAYPDLFVERFRLRLRAVHALALNDLKRPAEARQAAGAVCKLKDDDDLVVILRRERICR